MDAMLDATGGRAGDTSGRMRKRGAGGGRERRSSDRRNGPWRHIKSESNIGVSLLASQLVGIICQQLLPCPGGGLFPALEYFQNEAVTRRWIFEGRTPELLDHLQKSRGGTNCSLLNHLVAATQQGRIEADIARSACARPQDFDRAMRGIS